MFDSIRKLLGLEQSKPSMTHQQQANSFEDSVTIRLSESEWKKYDRREDKVRALLSDFLRTSPAFKNESIPGLIARCKKGYQRGGRLNFKEVFDDGEYLTAEQKRKIGLNTRMKFSKYFVSTLSDEGIASADPKQLFKNLYLQASNIIWRESELEDMKDSGIKFVTIMTLDGANGCKCSKKIDGKRFPIDSAPVFPLPNCDSPHCLCSYNAEIDMLAPISAEELNRTTRKIW